MKDSFAASGQPACGDRPPTWLTSPALTSAFTQILDRLCPFRSMHDLRPEVSSPYSPQYCL